VPRRMGSLRPFEVECGLRLAGCRRPRLNLTERGLRGDETAGPGSSANPIAMRFERPVSKDVTPFRPTSALVPGLAISTFDDDREITPSMGCRGCALPAPSLGQPRGVKT
jgi:hypothetical protein